MATTNPVLSSTWTRLVAAGDNFLLTLPFANRYDIEVATTDTDVAPTVSSGHLLAADRQGALTRELIGVGYLWAKAPGACTVSLNTWTPA